MTKNWLHIFDNDIQPDEIISIKQYIKKSGEIFARACTSDGRTFIKPLSPLGVEQNTLIKIPAYSTKAERNTIIKELSKTYTQDDIAAMLDLSQSTISNVLNNFEK